MIPINTTPSPPQTKVSILLLPPFAGGASCKRAISLENAIVPPDVGFRTTSPAQYIAKSSEKEEARSLRIGVQSTLGAFLRRR
jgi:hypothetical protein